MKDSKLNEMVADLLHIPPLIDRTVKRKLLNDTRDLIDMTPLQFEVVKLIEKEETQHVAQIGKKLEIAKAQMTKLIDRLVEMDFLERSVNKDDRRLLDIRLTEHCRTLLKETKKEFHKSIKNKLSSLPEEKMEELSFHLRQVKDILQEIK